MTPQVIASTSRTVALGDLCLEHQFWSNPRTQSGLSDKELDDLGDDIKTRGLQDPPKVQQLKVNGDVVNLVIDGQRRVLAALRRLPKTTQIPVIDRTEEPIDFSPEAADQLLKDMLSAAERREGLSSFELSEVAERLRNREHTLLDIAAAIGRSETWVSKMLKARTAASPKLMLEWKKGKLTDEQFKDLAHLEVDKQGDALKEVAEAKKSGDAAEARTVAKEHVARAKAKVVNGHNKTVSGPQNDLFEDKKPKVHVPSKVALEEIVSMADKRPPTSDYVKGIVDGVKYAIGAVEPSDFGKAWHQYLSRIGGTAKKVKAERKARKPGGKARVKKTAKKAKARKR